MKLAEELNLVWVYKELGYILLLSIGFGVEHQISSWYQSKAAHVGSNGHMCSQVTQYVLSTC